MSILLESECRLFADGEKRKSICRHKSFILLEIQLFWRQMQYKMNESTKTTLTFSILRRKKTANEWKNAIRLSSSSIWSRMKANRDVFTFNSCLDFFCFSLFWIIYIKISFSRIFGPFGVRNWSLVCNQCLCLCIQCSVMYKMLRTILEVHRLICRMISGEKGKMKKGKCFE